MNRSRFLRIVLVFMTAALLFSLPLTTQAAVSTTGSHQVVVPPPEQGSFFTLFDYAHDGRILAFDGFTVFIQRTLISQDFVELGHLPEAFRGATDPSVLAVSPDGQNIVLSGGAGGAKFPDPQFNGTLFVMPSTGGVATLVGTFPFLIQGTFATNRFFAFGEGETFGTFTGSVEIFDLQTHQKRTAVGNIPGDPGGLAFDRNGNLFVGLGAGQDTNRTGEIHRFTRQALANALQSGTPLDFDANSTILAKVLSGSDLVFDSDGHLFVGGANYDDGEVGFYAQVNPVTGQVVARFDPTDGNPNDNDDVFFDLSFTPVGCRIGALDLNSFFNPSDSIVYQRRVC